MAAGGGRKTLIRLVGIVAVSTAVNSSDPYSNDSFAGCSPSEADTAARRVAGHTVSCQTLNHSGKVVVGRTLSWCL